MNLIDLFYTSTKGSDKWNRYFDVYQRYLEKYEGKNITFVEVGIAEGGSLEMWSKFFGPESKLYGIDINPNCARLEYSPNVKVIIGDQGDPNFWNNILKDIGPIDAFLDDGGHQMNQQIVTFESVWPSLKTNGVYLCEDTHTSYFENYNSRYKNPDSFIEYSKDFVDILHLKETSIYVNDGIVNPLPIRYDQRLAPKKFAHDISSVHFYDSMVVFEKNERSDMARISPR